MNFDLFSERNSDAPHQYSSPLQETTKIQEIRLERENKTLLNTRNALTREIEQLEKQWNELQRLDADFDDADNEDGDKEDELIFDLLVENPIPSQRTEYDDDDDEEEEEEVDDDSDTDANVNGGDGLSRKVSFDESKYSAKPLRDWATRIEYLKKFYPYLRIHGAKSRLSLETDRTRKSVLIKTISFQIEYGNNNVFEIDVNVRLFAKQKNVYQTWKLELTKRSNNKFNTILIQMTEHFTKTKNINEFLFSLNTLYGLLITRQKTIDELNEEFNNTTTTGTVYTSTFIHRQISVTWDIMFQHGELYPLVTVNSVYNDVFGDMVELYGVHRAIRTLILSVTQDEH